MLKKFLFISLFICSINLFAMEPEQQMLMQPKTEAFKNNCSEITFENIMVKGESEATDDEIISNINKLIKKRDEYVQSRHITQAEAKNDPAGYVYQSSVTQKIVIEILKLYSCERIQHIDSSKLNDEIAFYQNACFWHDMTSFQQSVIDYQDESETY